MANPMSGIALIVEFTCSDPTKSSYNYKDITDPANPFLNASMVINMVGAAVILVAVVMPYIVRNFAQRRNQASFSVN